jgi:hypothetical protein
MNRRENVLRAVRFEKPATIPVKMSINNACWQHYPQDALQELMAEHPLLFPDFEPQPLPFKPAFAPFRMAAHDHVDSWGSVWHTEEDGITGTVIKHALPTWENFENYEPPDPNHHYGWGTIDWKTEAARLANAAAAGKLEQGNLRHGHTFLTLVYIRGYTALLYDMVDGLAQLDELIAMVQAFNLALVEKYCALGVAWMGYPEDLGMQQGPLISPDLFRTYIKPVYKRLMAPARDAGCVIHMHSDGDIRTLVPDLLDCGVDVLNLQDLVNGLGWIEENLKGKVCIDLDVDRQQVIRFGTPNEIDALIRREVEYLADPQGGLMLQHGLMPGLPLENVAALMDAMEKYALFY